jgi:uncharacterized membrane protein YoaK (UPF0700 family)
MHQKAGPSSGKEYVVVLAALIAGAVDGIGFALLAHLFTAHMSGNTISSGAHFGHGNWGEGLHRIYPIPVFVLGALTGAAVCEALVRRGVRSVHAVVLGLEALLLLSFVAGASRCAPGGLVPLEPAWRYYLLAALPALALGVQNAAVRRTAAVNVRTTYITGMLTNAAEEAVGFLFQFGDAVRRRPERGWFGLRGEDAPQPSLGRTLLYLGIWFAYFGGAVAGVWVQSRVGLVALAGPITGLVLLAVWDLAWPLRVLQPARHPDWRP